MSWSVSIEKNFKTSSFVPLAPNPAFTNTNGSDPTFGWTAGGTRFMGVCTQIFKTNRTLLVWGDTSSCEAIFSPRSEGVVTKYIDKITINTLKHLELNQFRLFSFSQKKKQRKRCWLHTILYYRTPAVLSEEKRRIAENASAIRKPKCYSGVHWESVVDFLPTSFVPIFA